MDLNNPHISVDGQLTNLTKFHSFKIEGFPSTVDKKPCNKCERPRPRYLGQSTVTLLALLHEAIPTHWSLVQLVRLVLQTVVHADLKVLTQGDLGTGRPFCRRSIYTVMNL